MADMVDMVASRIPPRIRVRLCSNRVGWGSGYGYWSGYGTGLDTGEGAGYGTGSGYGNGEFFRVRLWCRPLGVLGC
jgi:hypothetical protein